MAVEQAADITGGVAPLLFLWYAGLRGIHNRGFGGFIIGTSGMFIIGALGNYRLFSGNKSK